ncbi:MAG: cyclic lactone autoinducer peptide [Ruminococcus sp.]|nr:cyclic lactone autoinducer peptide [Ruminococcus sp.]
MAWWQLCHCFRLWHCCRLEHLQKGGDAMKLKNKLAQSLTACATSIARKAAGQVSVGFTHQPKEPAALKKQSK